MIILTAECPKSVKQIIQSDTPSFALINRIEGDDKLSIAYLVKLINDVVEHFNIGKTMNDIQVMNTARFILAEYGMYKLDDFIFCFDRAKKGKYGIVYDRIDGHILFEWIEKYLHERFEEVENIRINEKKGLEKLEKEDFAAIPMPDYIKEIIPKKTIPKEGEIRPLNQSDTQRQVNDWIKEFDLIWMEQGANSGKRFIMHDNIKMDIGEYLEYKLN